MAHTGGHEQPKETPGSAPAIPVRPRRFEILDREGLGVQRIGPALRHEQLAAVRREGAQIRAGRIDDRAEHTIDERRVAVESKVVQSQFGLLNTALASSG